MAKQHSKEDSKGDGFKLTGNPEEFIKLLVIDTDNRKWVTNQLEHGGPKHKQVLTALLCNRLYEMVRDVEKNSGYAFVLQDGYELIIEKDKETKVLPIPVPVNTGSKINNQKVIEAISHAPEHEVLAYAMCLQVIEWIITVKDKQLS